MTGIPWPGTVGIVVLSDRLVKQEARRVTADRDEGAAATNRGPATITVERRVEWSDTDAAGQSHFTSILRWTEQAEYVLYERLGIAESVAGRCPRVHLSVDFRSRAQPRQVVEIDLAVLEVGRSSVRYAFVVRREDETVAEGAVAAVFVRDGQATPWPADVRRRLLESGRVAGERFVRSEGGRDAVP
jgi:acyl-CoA thioesterase FadM